MKLKDGNYAESERTIDKSMIEYINEKSKSLNTKLPDNIYSALRDWLILGLQSGFRRKEWVKIKTI